MIHPTYVDRKDLPPILLQALESVGHHGTTIPVYIDTHAQVASVSGDGMRAFTILVDLQANTFEVHHGAWGGPSPWAPKAVDLDTKARPIPPYAAVINGHIGGGRAPYGSITIHPDRAVKLLPGPANVTDREAKILAVYAQLNSRGRKEHFDRYPTDRPSEKELARLADQNYIKVSKAGAVTVTAAGRNAAKPRI